MKYDLTLRFYRRQWGGGAINWKGPKSPYINLDEITLTVSSDEALYPFSKKCLYFIKNKVRWENSDRLKAKRQSDDSLELLQKSFEDIFKSDCSIDELIKKINKSDLIEVSFPFENEALGWAARVFPWEDTLSILSGSKSRNQPLLVIRHLSTQRHFKHQNADTLKMIMCVDSAPGHIKKDYNFSNEIYLALSAFHPLISEANLQDIVKDPTFEEFKTQIVNQQPSIVHIAAIDNLYFTEKLQVDVKSETDEDLGKDDVKSQFDGLVMASSKKNKDYDKVNYLEFSDFFAQLTSKPELIAYAACNTYSRLAPLTVASGVATTIGFDDNLSDEASSTFFDKFYTELKATKGDILAAYEVGFLGIHSTNYDYYTTPVLWTCRRLFHETRDIERISVSKFSEDDFISSDSDLRPDLITDPTSPDQIVSSPRPDPFRVIWETKSEINYSHLHNGLALFETLQLFNIPRGIPNVNVQIELIGVGDKAVWRKQIDTQGLRFKDINQEKPTLPLSAPNLRRVQETINASFSLTVKFGREIRYRDTKNVRILPIDQWTDDEENRKWLPSFVLPRDPAVSKIIRSADRYLAALTDNSNAGFDGYQRLYVTDKPDYDVVDLQVRAIWCAILYEQNIRYIDPPPTYSKSQTEQRLRTPTQILSEERATCIDTSILLASCLEYIGLHPVIFLIWGHAFPGWWRNPDEMIIGAEMKEMPSSEERLKLENGDGWVFDKRIFGEFLARLNNGSLAAIESTELCNAGGFFNALNATQGHFSDIAIFDAMIDIKKARIEPNPVTPLPIVFGDHYDR